MPAEEKFGSDNFTVTEIAHVQSRTHLFLTWMTLAFGYDNHAHDERRKLEAGDGSALDDEFRYSLETVVSSAFAVESFFGGFEEYITPPNAAIHAWKQANNWSRNQPPAAVRIALTLEDAFDMSSCPASWHDGLRWLFDERNGAAHFKESFADLDVHPVVGKVDPVMARFRVETADRALKAMIAPLSVASQNARPGNTALAQWATLTRETVAQFHRQWLGRATP